MKVKQEELISMKFDQLLTFLNDLTKSEFFTNINYLKYLRGELEPAIRNTMEMQKEINDIVNLKYGIKEFKFSNSMLQLLELEYNEIKVNLANLIPK